ncbi:hypothetical protein MATR_14980 [Marivirga tractuosa]|uniref:PKD-like domain-containing protein n=1 Tax=Marivirga tractuosa TaxID=1006 RepID=UPI002B290FFE|nr:hypothetical protein MATR_14980 [Marivirga tractuosa]
MSSLLVMGMKSYADVTITTADLSNICVDGGYYSLTDIVITENLNGDFANTSGATHYYRIELPPNFEFNPAAGTISTSGVGSDIDPSFTTSRGTTYVQIGLVINSENEINSIFFENFEVRAINSSSSGNITRVNSPSGTNATVSGAPLGSIHGTISSLAPPTISSDPLDEAICENGTASFSVSASGSGISYQWQRNAGSGFQDIDISLDGGIYSNFNSPTLNISNAPSSINGHLYQVEITGVCLPTATSSAATLTVNPLPAAPVVTNQSQEYCVNNITFTLPEASGGGGTFNWYSDEELTSFLYTGAVPTQDSDIGFDENVTGTYTAYVAETSAQGCEGEATKVDLWVKLTPNPFPTSTTTTPSSSSVCDGSNLTFTIDTAFAFNSYQLIDQAGDPLSSNVLGNGGSIDIQTISLDRATYGASELVRVKVTRNDTGCSEILTNLQNRNTISITPEPVGTTSTETAICSDVPLAFDLSTSADANTATYNITINTNGLTASAGNPVNGTGFPANEIADDAWINNSGSTVDVIYNITPVSANNCIGNTYTITFPIDPAPIVAADITASVCSGDAVGVNLPASDDNTNTIDSYDITATVSGTLTGTPSEPTGTTSINAISGDAFTNTSGANATITYTITPYIGSCPGNDFDIVVTVQPEPVVAANISTTICSGDNVGVVLPDTDDNGDAITTYDIAAALSGVSGSASTPNGTTSQNAILNDNFTNTSNSNGTVTYTITPYANGCPGNTFDVVVTVQPEPVVAANIPVAICSGDAVATNLPTTDDNGNAIDTYDITVASTGTFSGTPTTAIGTNDETILAGDTFVNNSAADATITYTITPYTSAGCAGNTFDLVVTVSPAPIVAADITASVCSGDAVGVNLPASDDNTNTIDSYDITATVSGTLTGTPSEPTGTTSINAISGDTFTNTSGANATITYTITPYIGSCPGNDFDIVVTVQPEPVVAANISTTICSGDNVGVVLPDTDDNGDAITTYDIAAALSGVSGSASTPNGTTSQNAILNDNFTNTSNSNGTVTYTITPYANGCPGNTFDVVVTVQPEPVVAANIPVAICSGDAVATNLPTTDDNGNAIDTYDITVASTGTFSGTPTTAIGTNDETILAGDTFVNNSAADATITYTITPYTSAGCAGNTFDLVVTVSPAPIVAADITASVCSGDAVGVNLPASDDNTNTIDSYDITATVSGTLTGTPSEPTGTSSINAISGDTFTNTSGANATITYTITPYIGSCPGNDFDIVVTVQPEPVVAANISTTICSGDNVGVVLPDTDDNGDAITTYDIAAALSGVSGSASTPNGTTSQNAILNDNFTNTSNSNGTVTYTITPYANGCPGNTFDVVVTVQPEPVVAANIPVAICSGDAVATNLPTTDDNGNAIDTYDITVASTGTFSGTPTTAIGTNDETILAGDTFVNNSAADATITYTITPYTSAGCAGNTFDLVVTVSPAPIVAADITASVCSGDAVGVNLPASDDNTNTIDSYDITATVSGTLTGTPSEPTGTTSINAISGDTFTNTSGANATITYTITPYIGSCPGNDFDIVVTVQPEPVVAANISTTICSGDNVGVVLPDTDDNGDAITTYDIAAALSGVSGSASTPNGTTSQNAILNDNFTNTSNSNGTVTYTITPYANGCPGNTFDVVVTVQPEPVVAANIPVAICSGDAVATNLPTTDDNGNAIDTYDITVASTGTFSGTPTTAIGTNDETILAGDTFVNNSAADATITYTITPYTSAGCAGNTFDLVVTVSPAPIVAADITASVCSGDAVGVNLPASDDNTNTIDSYDITATVSGTLTGTPSEPTGTTSINAISGDAFTNTSGANATITYTITPYIGSCPGNDFDIVVTVQPEPVVAANISTTICSGDNVGVVLPDTDDNGDAITTYDIAAALSGVSGSASTPNGTTSQNAILNDNFTNTSNSNGTVTYTITPYANGCPGNTFDVVVTVQPEPVVAANIPVAICSGDAVATNLPTTDDNGNAIDTYDITVASTGTFSGTPTTAIGTNDETILAGDTFVNNSAADATITYTITPYTSAGCAGNTFDLVVTVSPAPIVAADITASVCSGDAVGVNLPASDDNTNTIDSYDITATVSGTLTGTPSEPTGTTSINAISGDAFTNTSGANATITYTITPYIGSCPGNDFDIVVTVQPEPVVAANISTTICSGDNVGVVLPDTDDNGDAITTYDIAAALSGVSGSASTPNGTTSQNAILNDNFTNTSNSNGTVTYTITPYANGCPGNTFDVVVTVQPEPVVAANIPVAICSGDAVATNLPTTDDNGNAIDTYDITVASTGTFSGTPTTAIGTNDETILAGDTFVNNSAADATITYTITPYTSAGCAGNTFDLVVTVSPAPIVAADITASVCSGDAVGVNLPASDDNTNTIDSYDITATVSGTLTGTPSEPTGTTSINAISGDAFTNTSGANATITYTITPYIGSCPGNDFDIVVTVQPEPVVAANISTTICSGDNVGVVLPDTDDNGDAITTYDIAAALSGVSGSASTPNGTTSQNAILNDNFTNTSNSNGTVTYTITPYANGCPGNTFDVVVTVQPEPVVAANIPVAICSGDAVATNLPTTDDNGNAIDTYDITVASTGTFSGTPTTAIGTNDETILAGDTFVNNSAADATITYTITPYTSAGCAGNTFDLVVTVSPAPIVAADITASVCSGDAVGVNLPASDDNTNTIDSYDITATVSGTLTGTPSEPTGTTSINAISGDTFTNTSGANATITYTITPYIGSCPGNDFDIVVTVQPEPVVAANISTTICSGDNVGVVLPDTDDNGDAITTYDIAAALSGVSGSASTPNGTTSQNAILNDNFTNTSNSNGTVTYTITPYANGCPGNTFDVVVTVQPEPVVAANIPVAICSGDAVATNLPTTDDNGNAIDTYDITVASTGTFSGTPTTAIGTNDETILAGDTFVNNSAADATITYTITPYTSAGCAGNTFDLVVTVSPAPIVAADITASVCSGDAVGVNLPASDDNTNTIDSYDITATVSGTLTGTPSEPTGTTSINAISGDTFTNTSGANATITYTITPYIGSCPGNDFDIVVTVQPEPVVAANISTTICSGDNVGVVLPDTDDNGDAITTYDIAAALSGVSGSASTPNGTTSQNAILNDNFTNTSNSNGTVTYTITPYANGCPGNTFDVVVTVQPEPVVAANIPVAICSGDAVATNLPTTDDNGNAIDTYDITVASTGTFSGTPTTAIGTNDETILAGDTFVNNSAADATITYTITPYTSAGCAGNTFDLVVTVSPAPIVAADITASVCSGDAVGVNLPASDDNTNTIDSYDITATVSGTLTGTPSEPTGTTSINAISGDAFTNTSGANATITYTITPYIGSCPGNDFDIVVTVQPEPVVAANISTTICSGDNVGVVLPDTDDNGDAITTYDIAAALSGVSGSASTPNGTTSQNAILNDNFTNTSNSNGTVTYTITPYANGCPGNTFDVVVTVQPEPVVAANIPVAICSGDAVATNLPTTDDNGNAIDTYDITVASTGTFSGTPTTAIGTNDETILAGDTFVNNSAADATITYTITPYTSAGCAGNTFDLVVTVSPAPIVAADITASVCSGDAVGVNLPASDDNTNTIDSYDITATVSGTLTGTPSEPTGTTSINAISGDTFTNTSGANATITYTITPYIGSCPGNDFDIVVTVQPQPVFSPVPTNITACAGELIDIDFSTLSASDIITWSADNRNVFISPTAPTTGSSSLTFVTASNNTTSDKVTTFTVSASNSVCTTPVTTTFTITIKPTPDILNFFPPEPVCSNENAVDLTTLGLTANIGGGEFTFTGPGVNSVMKTFDATAAGLGTQEIQVTYTTLDGCSKTEEITLLDVIAEPTANAGGSDQVCVNTTYTVNDAVATNSAGLMWSEDGFGTLTNATTINPTYNPHPDDAGNIVTLTLTVSGVSACGDATDTKTLTIDERPESTITTTTAQICETQTLDLIATIAGGATSGNWSITGGNTIGAIGATTDNSGNWTATFSPSGTAFGTVTAQFEATTSNTCAPEVETYTFDVFENPTATIPANFSTCGDASFDLNATLGGSALNGNWAVITNGTPANLSASATSAGITSATYTPDAADYNSLITFQFTAEDPAAGPCGDNTYTVDVTIDEPAGVSISTAPANVCQTQTIALSGDFSGSASSASWSENGNGSLTNISTSGNTVTADYTPTAADIGNTVTFTLTTNNPANTCNAVSQTVDFIIDAPAQATVTTTTAQICETQTLDLIATIAGGATSGNWSITGGNTIGAIGATTDNSGNWTATFSPSGTAFGTVTAQFEATTSNTCAPEVETYTFDVFENPTATIPANFSTCGDASFDLNATLGGSALNGNWAVITNGTPANLSASATSAGITSATYTPDAADYNSLITFQFTAEDPAAGPCGDNTYTVDVTIDEPAGVSISTAPANVCQTQTIALSGDFSGSASSASWSENGNGSLTNISTSGNTVTADYTPTAADIGNTVTFTLTTNNPANTCNAVSQTVDFIIDAPAQATVTTTTAQICETQTLDLIATIAGGATSGNWSITGGNTIGAIGATTDNSGNWTATFSPSGTAFGTVTAQFEATTSNTCAPEVETYTFDVFENPTATIPANFSTCGDASFDLNATLGGSALNGNWAVITNGTPANLSASATSAGITSATYTPDAADYNSLITFQFTAEDPAAGPCGDNTYTVDVTIDEPAGVSISTAPANVCQTQTIALSGDFSGSASSASWSENGNGSLTNISTSGNTVTADYTPTAADIGNTVTFTLTTNNPANTCNAVSQTVDFIIDAPAQATVTTTTAQICETQTLDLIATIAGGATSGNWSITGGNTIGAIGATTDNSGNWTATFSPSGTAFGTVTAQFEATTSNTCAPEVETYTFDVFENPTATIPANFSTCGDASFDLNATLGGSALNGNWAVITNGTPANLSASATSAGITSATYTPDAADYNSLITFQFTAEDPAAGPCGDNTYTVDVTIDEPAGVSISTAPANVCQTQTIALSGDFSGSASSASWSENGNGSLTNISTSGNTVTADYTPTAADIGNTVTFTLTTNNPANTCNAVSQTVDFIIDAPAQATVTTTTAQICETQTLDLIATIAGGATSGNWSITGGNTIGAIGATTDNSGNWTATFSPSGTAFGTVTAQFEATTSNTCAPEVETYTFDVFENPTATIPANFSTCGDASFDLNATLGGSALNGNWAVITNGTPANLSASATSAGITSATYTPDAADYNSLITFQFTAEDPAAGPCGDNTYTVDVTIDEPAGVSISTAPANVCQTQTIALSGDFSGSASSASWSENGNGSLTNISTSGNTVTADYTPTAADIGNTVTFTLTTNNPANTCNAVSQTVDFIIDAPAQATVTTTTAQICETQTLDLIATIAGGATSGNWSITGGNTIGAIGATTDNSGNWTATFSPSGTAFGTVTAQFEATTSNTCAPEVETYTFDVFENPTATIPANFSTCGDASFDLNATLGGSALNGNWAVITNGTPANLSASATSAGITSATYTPDAADYNSLITFQFTAEDPAAGPCGDNTYTVDVTIDEPAGATVTSTATEVCEADPFTLSGTISGGANAGEWRIKTGQTSAAENSGTLSSTTESSGIWSATFTPDGTYQGFVDFEFVAFSANTCSDDVETYTLNIRNIPVVINQSYSYCEDIAGNGTSNQNLTAYNDPITDENLGDVTITWYTNNTLATEVTDDTDVDVSNGETYYAKVQFNSTNCFDVAEVDFTVNPQIVIEAGSNQEICDGEILDLTESTVLPNQSNASNLLWTSSGDGTFDFDSNLRPIYTPGSSDLSNSPITLRLTGSNSTSCTDVFDEMQLTIKPIPVIVDVPDENLCAGESLAPISFNADISGGTFTWSATNFTQLGLGTSSGSGNFPATTAQPNTTGSTITSVVTVNYMLNGCPAGSKTFNINVNPTPVTDDIQDINVCPGEPVNINFNANTIGETFNWNKDGNTVAASPLSTSGSGDISFVSAENFTGSAITSQFTYSATLNSCSSITKTFRVNLLPQPEIDPISPIVVCSFDNISTNFTSDVPGATYSWTNDNTASGIAAAGNGNINVTASENTTSSTIVSNITVTATKDGCVSDVQTFAVTVKPKPVIQAESTLEICPGDAISTIILTDDSGGNSTISWTATNASAIGLPASSGTGNIPSFTAKSNNSTSTITSNITVTSTWNGCVSDQMNFQIRLKPTPIMNAVSDEELCAGENYIVTFGNSLGATTSYTWVNDNPAIGLPASGSGDNINFTAASNTTGSDIVANIQVTPSNNGCVGPDEVFTITLKPTPVISNISDVELCSDDFVSIPFTVDLPNPNLNVSISDNSLIDGGISIVDNKIEFTTSVNTSGVDQTATVSLNAEKNTCTSVETFILTLKYKPVVSSVPDRAAVCPGEIITGQSFGHDVGTGSFGWEITNPLLIGDATASSGTGNLPSFQAANNITGEEIVGYVKYFSTRNACLSDADSFKISIKPAPVITNTDIIFCDDEEANISFSTNTSTTNASGDVTYYWTNSNTSIGVNNPSGTTNDKITASNFFTNTVSATNDNVATIEVYAVIDGCTGPSKTFEVRVKPLPVITTPDVEFSQTTCSGDTFNFNPTANISATQFSWNLVSNPGAVTGVASSGTGNISLDLINNTNTIQTIQYSISTLNGNCPGETSVLNITVYPELNLQPLPAERVVCSGGSFEIALGTTNNVNVGGENVIYEWEVSPNNVGATAGVGTQLIETLTNNKTTGERDTVFYYIRPTLNNGLCVGLRDTLPVIVNPDAIVYAGVDTTVCQGQPVLLEATIDKGASSGSWSGGIPENFNNRNSLSTFYTPSASEVGRTITFTFTSNDPDGSVGPCTAVSDQVDVTIDELPTALITENPFPTGEYCVRNGRLALSGNNTNYSSPDVVFDGPGVEYISAEQRYYFYPDSATVGGPYNITYSVTNANGCVNTDEVAVSVTNGLSAGFRVNNALSVGSDYVVCFNQSEIELIQDERNVIGEFDGNGVEFNAKGVPIFNPTSPDVTDTTEVSFEILDPATGCLSQSSVNIIRLPEPVFEIEESKVCDRDYSIVIQDLTVYDNDYDQIVGQLSYSQVDNNLNKIASIDGDTITFATPGSKEINVTWNFDLGCTQTKTLQVNVGNIESMDFNIDNIKVTNIGQSGTSFTVEEDLASITIQEYIWFFGDGSPLDTTTNQGIEHNFTEAGTYDIILTAIDEYGCPTVVQKTINIVPAITAADLPYFETFENNNGAGWFTIKDSTSTSTSWIYNNGVSSFDNEINSSDYWMTTLNGKAGFREDERSYLVGPTFDLTSLERPTLSFDMFLDFQDGDNSGARVEYNLGDGEWQQLGVLNDELNWYNAENTELFDNDTEDAGQAWADNSNANDERNQVPYVWSRVAHTLDHLKNEGNITFRITFASNDYDEESLGMAIDNFYVGERQKKVLLENFTNTNLREDYITNRTNVENLLTSELGNDLLPLNFHISIPKPDSINLRNSIELDSRASVYSIEESPKLVVDGELFKENIFDSNNDVSEALHKRITRRSLLEPSNLINIDIDENADEHTVRFDATLIPSNDSSANLTTYFFVIEKNVNQSDGLNNIVRKIIPNINGVNMDELTERTVTTFEWEVSSIYYEDLAVVSVLQDRNTNSILEIHVENINQPKSPGQVLSVDNGFESLGISVYPNPSRGKINMAFSKALSSDLKVFILDNSGKILKNTIVSKGSLQRELDLTGFASGVYHIITKNPEGKLNRQKVVIID